MYTVRILTILVALTVLSMPAVWAQSRTAASLPAWDKNFPLATRFTVLELFDGEAVRDNNTGLIWQRTIDGTPRNQVQSMIYCLNIVIGGTTGWRLPTVAELSSVRALEVPGFPPNYPAFAPIFTNVHVAGAFWSSTADQDPTVTWPTAWALGLAYLQLGTKGGGAWAWCVRGSE